MAEGFDKEAFIRQWMQRKEELSSTKTEPDALMQQPAAQSIPRTPPRATPPPASTALSPSLSTRQSAAVGPPPNTAAFVTAALDTAGQFRTSVPSSSAYVPPRTSRTQATSTFLPRGSQAQEQPRPWSASHYPITGPYGAYTAYPAPTRAAAPANTGTAQQTASFQEQPEAWRSPVAKLTHRVSKAENQVSRMKKYFKVWVQQEYQQRVKATQRLQAWWKGAKVRRRLRHIPGLDAGLVRKMTDTLCSQRRAKAIVRARMLHSKFPTWRSLCKLPRSPRQWYFPTDRRSTLFVACVAAQRIQAFYRGYRCRQHVSRLIILEAALHRIERWWKSHSPSQKHGRMSRSLRKIVLMQRIEIQALKQESELLKTLLIESDKQRRQQDEALRLLWREVAALKGAPLETSAVPHDMSSMMEVSVMDDSGIHQAQPSTEPTPKSNHQRPSQQSGPSEERGIGHNKRRPPTTNHHEPGPSSQSQQHYPPKVQSAPAPIRRQLDAAATRIQAVIRGHQARQSFRALLRAFYEYQDEISHAASIIQRFFIMHVKPGGSRDEYREDVADMEAFDQHLEEELSNLFSEYEGSHSGSRYHDQDAEYEGYVQRHSRDARYGGVEEEAEHKYSGHYDEAEVSGSESSEGRAWRDDDNSFHSDEEGDGGENHVTTAPLKHPAYQWSGTRDAQPRGYAAIHRGFKD